MLAQIRAVVCCHPDDGFRPCGGYVSERAHGYSAK
jgi:hypothetical protein